MGENAAPAVPAAAPAASLSVEADLATKLSELKQVQDRVAEQTQKANVLQAEIKSLQAKVAEVQQALNGYEASSQAMTKRFEDAKNLALQKAGIAEAAIDADKLKIDQKIADFDQALGDQGKKVQDAHDAAEAAMAAANNADVALSQKQADYVAVKKIPKVAETLLTELSRLLDQINKAEAQSDFVSVYFLSLEMNALSERIRVPTVADYSQMLRTAQAEVETAKSDVADKKAQADQLSAALVDAKQKYEAALASRRTDLLSALRMAEARAA